MVLLPTVEGVRPSAATANGVSITILPIIVVAAVGGALLLLIIIISFITLVVATCNRNPTSHRKGVLCIKMEALDSWGKVNKLFAISCAHILFQI